MTRWKAINELVAIADYIGDKEFEMKKEMGHQDICKFMRKIRLDVGDFFNSIGGQEEMKFSIGSRAIPPRRVKD